MVPTSTTEDPFTQYLLGASLVILIIGSVGGLAQYLHFSELPSLAYTATILVLVVGLFAAAVVYQRFLSHRLVGTERIDTPAVESAERSEMTDADESDETDVDTSTEAETTTETPSDAETDAEIEDVTEPSTRKSSE